MSKQFNKTISFNGSVDQILDMFRSESFHEALAHESTSHSFKLEIKDNSALVSSVIETHQMPSDFKKLIGKSLKIFTEQKLPLSAIDDDETCGVQKIQASVKQASANANLRFYAVGSRCEVTYVGKVKFDFPIGASKAESILLKFVLKGIDELEDIGNRWLEEKYQSNNCKRNLE